MSKFTPGSPRLLTAYHFVRIATPAENRLSVHAMTAYVTVVFDRQDAVHQGRVARNDSGNGKILITMMCLEYDWGLLGT